MKTLRTLIRLKKDEADKLKKELTQIEERQRILKDEHHELGVQLELEATAATNFPECASAFAAFAKKTIERQRALLKNIEMLQVAIDKKRDELLDAFSELKKFEIALDQRLAAERGETQRRETIMMNEVALRGFVRKDAQ